MHKRWVELGWLEARLAMARSDHAEVAAAADRILAARATWFGKRRAADCLRLAWRCVCGAPSEQATAADYGARAAALYGEVIAALADDVDKDPGDPWFALPYGCACVRAAELAAAAGDEARARDLLARALPLLEAVRAEAHADQWDEEAAASGAALQARLRR